MAKAKTANPIIPNLYDHIEEKVYEILRMKPEEARSYDTVVAWAFFQLITKTK